MNLKQFQVDAFTARPFGGNPAAVVPLESWLDDGLMRRIAAENNLSETAFFVARDDGGFDIRWFTPTVEAELCGHATLASAWVLFHRLDHAGSEIRFHSRGGDLNVSRTPDNDRLMMDFPAWSYEEADIGDVAGAIGIAPSAVFRSEKNLAIVESADQVRNLTPDLSKIAALEKGRLIVSAPGVAGDCDFVSRFFAPAAGIPEDPVTGSAHCVLTPYWASRLGKTSLHARQVSARGGEIWCTLDGDRVSLLGYAAPYLEGTITV